MFKKYVINIKSICISLIIYVSDICTIDNDSKYTLYVTVASFLEF